ncbi:Hypothetical protein SMAX5B_022254 [Scophthalmus maximus]|uniref:Uncharacterized protein n=1 Tax=Scophthalmus maximus TaxID=52904 RepID=A0A2U9C602_SCOMX|nr:Hypothetical protein SMAX5B_022254 [Scophthalmus maximus]KAF0042246.1 hypothetical protein F2P81_005778 [Scophthalmus maximus]
MLWLPPPLEDGRTEEPECRSSGLRPTHDWDFAPRRIPSPAFLCVCKRGAYGDRRTVRFSCGGSRAGRRRDRAAVVRSGEIDQLLRGDRGSITQLGRATTDVISTRCGWFGASGELDGS